MRLFHIPHRFISEQKWAHFCFEWSIVGYVTGAFLDLVNWSITRGGGGPILQRDLAKGLWTGFINNA